MTEHWLISLVTKQQIMLPSCKKSESWWVSNPSYPVIGTGSAGGPSCVPGLAHSLGLRLVGRTVAYGLGQGVGAGRARRGVQVARSGWGGASRLVSEAIWDRAASRHPVPVPAPNKGLQATTKTRRAKTRNAYERATHNHETQGQETQDHAPPPAENASTLSGAATASTAARGRQVRERGGARGRDKTGTGQAGLWGVSWPNNRLQATASSLRSFVAAASSSA